MALKKGMLMKEVDKKSEQLLVELVKLRQKIKELEASQWDQKKLSQSQEETLQHYRQMVDEAPFGFHELDRTGRIFQVNRTELEMLGYAAEDMVGFPVWQFVVEEEVTRQVILAKLAGDVSFHETFERTYRRKDGTTLPVLVVDRVNLDKQGKISGIRSTIEDVTERREAEEALRKSEEQLRQFQKFEAVGRLAGGVAHDFNNLLMTIKGASELLLQAFDPEDPRRDEVEEISKAAEQATSLTQQLLAFGRRQVLQPQVLDLNVIVSNMHKMLRRLIGEDIDLLTLSDLQLWPVKVDRGQIEQVLLNLAVNSRDAMPLGGKLTIELANVHLDEAYARWHVSVKPGPYVLVAVTDTGCGMDKENMSHLFEPFFTTKEKGKGTGLGLSTVFGIVKQSGGNIWAYSEPGRGTTFKVYLPRAEEKIQQPIGGVTAPTVSPRGTETILLVEDEEEVRKLIGRILRNNGYTVLEAHHGAKALEISTRHEGAIDLMVTDVVMPQMSGRELADRLLLLRPGLRVLYMSGYPDNAIMHHGVLEPGTAYLQKPFSVSVLEQKVRGVLDARR